MDSITIIGSGLSGPLLSLLLAKEGYKVELYEKRIDLRKHEISAGRSINLALSHRGIEALKQANVFDRVKPHLIPMKGRMIHSEHGELDFQPYSINPEEYINSVSRSKLNEILMTAAEETGKVNINFGNSLVTVDDNNLTFSTGVTIPNQGIILGADGTGSQIRKYIDRKIEVQSFTKPLGHAYKELNIAPNENDSFQLDSHSLHIWPRGQFMLIALPNTDKSFTCTLFMPNSGNISFESITSENDVVNFFHSYFNDALPIFEDFPQSFFKNPTGKLSTVYANEWQYKNCCILGDAAHAIVPFFGQGMNASFEDCVVLMNFHKKYNGNWEDILVNFTKFRKSDTDAIAQMAIENYIEMRDSVTQADFIQKKKIANKLYKAFPKRFIPRYNMVSFTSIPYAQVYKRGQIQQEIIAKLNNQSIDFSLAKELITERLPEV